MEIGLLVVRCYVIDAIRPRAFRGVNDLIMAFRGYPVRESHWIQVNRTGYR